MVLGVLMLVMLLLTMFIESLAVLIILTPLIVQVVQTFGLDPIHVGVLMVLATQIGATTPPVAVLLFVATSISGGTYGQTIRHCWPFIGALAFTLLLVFFFPGLATWIPEFFLK